MITRTSETECLLLVEDDYSDVMLVKRALSDGQPLNLVVAHDGIEAMEYLRRQGKHHAAPRPDLILLDLNMPRMDGRETLAAIKSDANLCTIPVVVLTTSDADWDILQSYQLQANCYVTKPLGLEQFTTAVQAIRNFWFGAAQLPPS